MGIAGTTTSREPWNKGKIIGQKAPFEVKDTWALRARLSMGGRPRELALFNLGIDSKLRDCDLVALKVRDVCHGDQVATRATIMQHKTQRPVQFELTAVTRDALQTWITQARSKQEDFLFPSRLHASPHLGTRQYAPVLGQWVDELGLDRRLRAGQGVRPGSIGATPVFGAHTIAYRRAGHYACKTWNAALSSCDYLRCSCYR